MSPSLTPTTTPPAFYGDTVVRAAFVLAVFGWGVGFYGPPIFMAAVVLRTGWSLALVSSAVTLHFLVGAAVVACLPRIHRRVGVAAATAAGAAVLAVGVVGWAVAAQPWQLFAAAALSGAGWVPLGAAGINAIVSPWFAARRPLALAKAYNGASVGGMVFSPLWVALIGGLGFATAALLVGAALVATVWLLAGRVFNKTPARLAQTIDGAMPAQNTAAFKSAAPASLRGATLWRQRAFLTLVAAMALGLFAQIGLIAHLYSLLAPRVGAAAVGWVMALATGCGMAGRTLAARLLGAHTRRRRVAAASYGVQAAGTALMLLAASTGHLGLTVLGVALFGLGIGNATSLPPLIAQQEFAPDDVPRVVAQSVAVSQALYAFAPAVFALLLGGGGWVSRVVDAPAGVFFGAVLLVQGVAMGVMVGGNFRRNPRRS